MSAEAKSGPTSVADLKSRFESNKSPTSTGSKVAELKAKLEKSPSATTVASTTSPTNAAVKPPVIARSNSAKSLTSSSSPSTEDATVKTVPRSASAGKLPGLASNTAEVLKAPLPEPPKVSQKVAAPSAAPKPEKRPLEEESAPQEVKPASKQPAPVKALAPVLAAPSSDEPIAPEVAEIDESGLTVSIDATAGVPEPIKVHSPTSLAASRLRFATDFSIPPTVEEQDYYVLWGLSFLVPFFLLRFVFEFVRKFVLTPARLAVRFAPGGSKLLSWLYVKTGPVVLKGRLYVKERLPPMDSVNAAARAGLDKFLATMQTAGGAAYPHLIHLAESIKTLKFREAALETIAVLKAWAPMLLLLIPLTKNTIIGARQACIVFWKVSKTAVYLPFGRFLRRAVQSLGQTLSENPDIFAERVAGLLGPIVGAFVTSIFLVGAGLVLGLVDYETLSSLYIAWFFRLLGMVSEPSLLDQSTINTAIIQEGVMDAASVQDAVASNLMDSAAAAEGANAADSGAGWIW